MTYAYVGQSARVRRDMQVEPFLTMVKKVTAIILVLMTTAESEGGHLLAEFVADYLAFYGLGHAYLVTQDRESCSDFNSFTCIEYSASNIVPTSRLVSSLASDKDSSLVFLAKQDHSALLEDLNRSVFRSAIPVFLEKPIRINLSLSLDSRVYLYTELSNSISLEETYAIKNGPLVTNQVGVWTAKSGLQIDTPQIWERRGDLRGVALIDSLLEFKPLAEYIYHGKNLIGATGLFVDVLKALSERLNFTISFASPADGKWGSLKEDNVTWSGLVGVLSRREADVVTCGLTPTAARYVSRSIIGGLILSSH